MFYLHGITLRSQAASSGPLVMDPACHQATSSVQTSRGHGTDRSTSSSKLRSYTMAEGTRSEELAAQAKFVFQGTVRQVRATTMREVPVTDNTVVVRVERLIHASEALTDYAGQEITVQLAAGESVEEGQTYIFYTNGWIFGDGLAVQSIGHEVATAPAVAGLSIHPDDPVRSLE